MTDTTRKLISSARRLGVITPSTEARQLREADARDRLRAATDEFSKKPCVETLDKLKAASAQLEKISGFKPGKDWL